MGWRNRVVWLLAVSLLVPVGTAGAIPAFARRYKVSCSLCHNPIPKLTDFGAQFAANGFRFASGEEPRDTLDTGDALLALAREFPLAVRLDAYAQAYANGRAVTDFQTPYGIKILSSGPFSKNLSYYFYAFLFERGEVGGVEDAFLHLNDLGGQPVDVALGQFQISDPLFKRELRLEFEDYAVYRANVGDVPVNLTYDRGLMVTADVAGFTLTGEVLNGNGKGAAQSDRHFDSDAFKNVFLHVTRDLGSNLRLGAFGMAGRTTSDDVKNTTNMFGVDATVGVRILELNGQYLYREDDHPTFSGTEPKVTTQGGFAELLVRPTGSRWYGFGLYNLVTTDRPLLDVGLGTPAGVRRYESLSAGVGRLERRNFRWTAEATWDLEQETLRWTLGFVTAF